MQVSLNIHSVNTNSNKFRFKKNNSTNLPDVTSVSNQMLKPFAYTHQINFKGEEKSEYVLRREEQQRIIIGYKADLDWANKWSYNSRKNELWAERDKELKEYGALNFVGKSRVKKSYKEKLDNENERYKNIQKNKDIYKTAITTGELDVKALDDAIKTERSIDELNNFLSRKGGLNDRIAGYQTEKDEVVDRLITPLSRFKRDKNTYIPPATIFYGATGTGKTTFVDGITESVKEVVEKISFPKSDPKMFERELDRQLLNARIRYKNTGKRTILVLDDAENFLNTISKNQSNELRSTRQDNVDMMKKILNFCSDLPTDLEEEGIKNLQGSATTILITTNYPHLIDPDVRTRYGKIGGEMIAINPPEKNDIEAVLKHNTKNAFAIIEQRPDVERFDLDIDKIPFEKIAIRQQPILDEGNESAYSNDRLRVIVENAVKKYIKDPDTPFKTYLGQEFKSVPRDLCNEYDEKGKIVRNRYKEFIDIYKRMTLPPTTEIESLEELEEMGCLSEEQEQRLAYIRQNNDKPM